MTSGSSGRAPSILAVRAVPVLAVPMLAIPMLAIALLGVGPAAAAPFRLIITDLTTPLVPGSVLDLADRLGYFRRAGVEVELVRVQQTPSALAALKAGEGDMADVGTDAALGLIARGVLAGKVVAAPARSIPYLVVGRADIGSVAELKGRSFGVGRIGSADQGLVAKVLAGAGVPAEAVDFVALGQPAARLQALLAGRIDATTVSTGTWATLPDRANLRVIIDQAAFHAAAPVVTKVDVVPDAVLRDKREEVVAVVRAIAAASRDFAARPELWVDAVAAVRTEVPREALAKLAASFKDDWSVDGGLAAPELQLTADWLFAGADFAGLRKPPLADWADLSVEHDALRGLGPAASPTPSARDAPAR